MSSKSQYGRIAFSMTLSGMLTLVLLPSFTAPPALTGLALTLIFTGFACDCVAGVKDQDKSAPGLPLVWMIAALLAASLSLQAHTWQGVERTFVWLACVAGCVTLRNRTRNPSDRTVLTQSFLLLFVVIALRTLAERLYLYDSLRELARESGFQTPDAEFAGFFSSERARATFGQANGLGGFLLMALPLLLAALPGKERSLPAWILIVLCGLCLWASASKGSTLVFVFLLGFCLNAWSGSPTAKKAGRLLIVAAAAGVAICALALVGGIFPSWSDGWFETLRLRLDYWTCAAEMITQKGLLGVGAGLFGDSFYLFADTGTAFSRYAHNGYLGVMAEFGFSGSLLLALLLRAWWQARPGMSPESDELKAEARARFPFEFLVAFILAAPTSSLDLLAAGGWWTSLLTTLPAALLLHFILTRPIAAVLAGNSDRLRQAAWLAACGFLLHSLVDFDVQITGLTATLALLIALPGKSEGQGSGNPALMTASFLLGIGLTAFWILGPQSAQVAREAQADHTTLTRWPVDLRMLNRESRRIGLSTKERKELRQAYDDLSPSFGHLPVFHERWESLREK